MSLLSIVVCKLFWTGYLGTAVSVAEFPARDHPSTSPAAGLVICYTLVSLMGGVTWESGIINGVHCLTLRDLMLRRSQAATQERPQVIR